MADAPYSQEAEEAVIGAVLTSPIAYLNVSSFLKPDDFFFLKHSYIWEAMRSLIANGDEIDTVTVSERLQATGQLVEIGGPAFLTQLISKVPTSVHAEVYGHLVERAALRRRLMQAADEIKLLAIDETLPVENICMQAEGKLLDVTGFGVEQTETDVKIIAHKYLTTVEELIALREQGIVPGLPTGFELVDDIIGGAYKQEIIVIAGPPKSGKTTWSLNIVRNRVKVGAHIAIFSVEMSEAEIMRKLISAETGIPVATIKNVAFTARQYSQFVEATNKISQWPLHIVDAYKPLTPIDIRRELRKIVQNDTVDNLLIDGLWLMNSNSTKRSITERRNLEVKDIMIELLNIATEFNVSIDLVHQCNSAANSRNRSDKRFQLFDLGESIDVARNAQTLIGLYRESYYNSDAPNDDIEVIVKANRNGNTGTAILQFDKAHELYTCGKHEVEPAQAILPINVPGGDRKDTYH